MVAGGPLAKRSRARGLLAFSAALLVSLGLAGAFVSWQLNRGGLSLPAITPIIAAALSAHLGEGRNVEVGSASISRDGDGRITIEARDIRVTDAEGRKLAAVPRAILGLDGLPIGGRAALRRIDVADASVALRIGADGLVAFAAGPAGPTMAAEAVGEPRADRPDPGDPSPPTARPENPATPEVVDLTPFRRVGVWLDLIEASGLDGAALSRFGLRNGTLLIDDTRTGRRLVFAGVDVDLASPTEGGATLRVAATGQSSHWTVTTTISRKDEAGSRQIDAAVKDLAPRDLMLASNHPDAFIAETPLSGVLRATIDAAGDLKSMNAELMAGTGVVGHRSEERLRLAVDGMAVRLAWRRGQPGLVVEELHAASGLNRISLSAVLVPPKTMDGTGTIEISRLEAVTTFLNPDEPPAPIQVSDARLVLDHVARTVTIERAEATSGGVGAIAIQGTVLFEPGKTPGLDIGFATSRMPVAAYYRMWPGFVAPQLREWLTRNLTAGVVEQTAFAIRVNPGALVDGGPPLPPSAMSLTGRVRGATLAVLPGAPPLRDAELDVRVDGQTTRLTMPRAYVEPAPGKRLAVAQGLFEIADHRVPDPRATARFRIEGPADAAAILLRSEAFRAHANGPTIPTVGVRGMVTANVSVATPLKDKVAPNEITYRLEADFTGFAADNAFGEMKLENATLRVVTSTRDLVVTGEGRLGGAQATFDYRRARPDAKPVIRLAATLDDAGRARIGLRTQGMIAGPTPVRVVTEGEDSGRYIVDVDLTPATVTELLPGWTKPRGQPGRARFTAVELDDGWRIDDLSVESRGVLVRGSMVLDGSGELRSAHFPAFHLRDGDRVAMRVERQGEGHRVSLRGDTMDARAILRSLTEPPRAPSQNRAPARDVEAEIRIGVVAGANGETVRQMDLRATRRGGELRALAASGRIGRDAPFAAELRGQGAAQRIVTSAGDAGALLRFLDIYPSMQGGRLSLIMAPILPDGSIREGTIEVTDFSIRGDRAIADMVADAANPEADGRPRRPSARQATSTDGSAFSRLKADFSRRGNRISVTNGLLWGAAIGATVEGEFDLAADRIDLIGTYVPAYAVNNAFARIPVLGVILGGSPDEGVFGITYRITGRASQPRLMVNPLSAVTPGLLRKIFEFRARGATAQPIPREDGGTIGSNR